MDGGSAAMMASTAAANARGFSKGGIFKVSGFDFTGLRSAIPIIPRAAWKESYAVGGMAKNSIIPLGNTNNHNK